MPLSDYAQQGLRAKFGPNAIVHFGGTHKFLSNFTKASVVLDGVVYPTSEHAFQAQKTTDAAVRARIASAKTAKEAKAIGRMAASTSATPGWFSGGRDEAMRRALEAKVRPQSVYALDEGDW